MDDPEINFTEQQPDEAAGQSWFTARRIRYLVIPAVSVIAAACAVVFLWKPGRDSRLSAPALAPNTASSAAVSSRPPESSAAPSAPEAASSASPQVSLATAAAQVTLGHASRPLSVNVSLAEQRVTVYDAKDRIVKQFVCSTGSAGNETPTGSFRIQERGESFYSDRVQEGGYYWTQFQGNYLFHSLPFDKNRQMEPEEAAKIGTPASHGCVRLELEDAKWIYDNIPRGTHVTIQ